MNLKCNNEQEFTGKLSKTCAEIVQHNISQNGINGKTIIYLRLRQIVKENL